MTLECISSGFDVPPDEGWLQRAVKVNGQLHIIEELQLFEEPQPVDSIVISEKQVWNECVHILKVVNTLLLPIIVFAKPLNSVWIFMSVIWFYALPSVGILLPTWTFLCQMSVYVGSASSVVQLPLSTCSRYSSCFDCVMARDPFCAWDGLECVDITSHNSRYECMVMDTSTSAVLIHFLINWMKMCDCYWHLNASTLLIRT